MKTNKMNEFKELDNFIDMLIDEGTKAGKPFYANLKKTELQKTLKEYFSQFKQYRFYSLSDNNIEKTFNNGNGSLSLFHFDIEAKTVIVNDYLVNKRDYVKLNEFLNIYNLDFKIVEKTLSYPEWYTTNLKTKI